MAIYLERGMGIMARARQTGIRKRPSGGYEYRFTYNGVRVSVGGGSIKECKAKAEDRKAEIDTGIYNANDNITLNQYFKEWITQKEMSVKPATILMYQSTYNNHIKPILGRYKIKKIERRQIVSMINDVVKSGKLGAAAYVRRTIVSILNSAMADEIISRNVAANVKSVRSDKPPARETIHREITDQELEAVFHFLKNTIHYNACRFMLYTGVRVGECCGLQWKDIDRKHGIIHIRRTATRDLKARNVLGDSTKTKKSRRDIPMNKDVSAVIEEQWELYINTHDCISLCDYVFPSRSGTLANGSAIGQTLTQAEKKARAHGFNIPYFSVHAFRDTFASRAVRAGISPNTLKELLGHSSLAMTMDLYAHVNQEDKIEGMKKLQVMDF